MANLDLSFLSSANRSYNIHTLLRVLQFPVKCELLEVQDERQSNLTVHL